MNIEDSILSLLAGNDTEMHSSEIHEQLPGATQKLITARLVDMMRDGMVKRQRLGWVMVEGMVYVSPSTSGVELGSTSGARRNDNSIVRGNGLQSKHPTMESWMPTPIRPQPVNNRRANHPNWSTVRERFLARHHA